jgi:hypothetical protein
LLPYGQEGGTSPMQGLLILFLVLFLVLILTSWVMAQPLRRNEAMREAVQARRAESRRDYTGAERRRGRERRVAERRRTETDASLGHA